jgi:hypothetical protein
MDKQQLKDKLSQEIEPPIPLFGSFKAWYILLLLVLLAEIIFFIWFTQNFS